jgi:hypothetical protein
VAASEGERSLASDGLLWVTMLITVAICAPFFRYVMWFGDEGIVLNAADRILRGDRLYGDFFEFLPPGSFLVAAAWMQLIGSSFASMRVLAIGVIVAIAGLMYVSARLTSGNRTLAALLAITWAVVSQGPWTVISHHWFATAASMAAAVWLLWALGDTREGYTAMALAGMFAGIAAMVTPVQGTLLCLAVVGLAATRPDRRRAVLGAVGGVGVFPAAALGYLAATGTLAPAFYDVILFPARHYMEIEIVRFGAFTAPHHVPAVAFLPLTFFLAGLAAVVDGRALWRQARFRGALALAIVALLSAFPRPDFIHICFVLPLACALFALVTENLLGRLGRRTRWAVGLALIAFVGVLIANVTYKKIVPIATGTLRPVSTARGVFMATPSAWIEAVAVLIANVERTPATEPFFFYPYSPLLAYFTAREHVAPHDVMIPGHTTAEQYHDVCLRVVRDARWVVMDRSWSDPRLLRGFYPNMRDPDPPEKRQLEAALRLAFDQVVHATPVFELRHRGGAVGEASCGSL